MSNQALKKKDLSEFFVKMSDEEYFSHKANSRSDLDQMLKTPAHYKAYRDSVEIRKTSDAQKFGSATHTAILEPELFHQKYKFIPKMTRMGKKWEAELTLAEAEGKEILWTEEKEQILSIIKSLESTKVPEFQNKSCLELLRNSLKEVVALWSEDGIECRGKLDAINEHGMFDLKTTESVNEFDKSVTNYNYHRQVAFYERGVKILTGQEIPFYFIVVEKSAPYLCAVRRLDEDSIEVGTSEVLHALQKVKQCEKSNQWPGYGSKVEACSLMPWYKSPLLKRF